MQAPRAHTHKHTATERAHSCTHKAVLLEIIIFALTIFTSTHTHTHIENVYKLARNKNFDPTFQRKNAEEKRRP